MNRTQKDAGLTYTATENVANKNIKRNAKEVVELPLIMRARNRQLLMTSYMILVFC